MQQRPAPTPARSRLLLSVAVYAAVVTMAVPGRATSWCWEIRSSDGCSSYIKNSKQQLGISPPSTDTCNRSPRTCDGVSITLNHSIVHVPGSVPDRDKFKILLQWAPHSDVSHYYLQKRQLISFRENCERYSLSLADQLPGHRLFSVYVSRSHYAAFEEKNCIKIELLVTRSGEECVASSVIPLRVPVTCYDGTRDCSQCGSTPLSTRLNVRLVESLVGMDQLVAHTLTWDWQHGYGQSYENETYHVRVREGRTERWLEVINQTEVVLEGLNASSTYTVDVWRYECGCDRDNPMGQLTLSPVDVTTLSAASTLVSTSPSLPISSPHSALAPCSPSSLPLSSHSSPSSSHPSPSPSPLRTILTNVPPSPSPHTINAMTTIFLTIVLVVATVAIATLMGILIYLKRRSRPQSEEKGGTASKRRDKVIDCVNPIDIYPSPVLVLALYSQQTPEKEVQAINNLLVGGLKKFDIEVETPGTAQPRQLSRDWIEKKVKTAHAVLLVCNQQFYEESQGEGDGLHVGSVAKLMLESLSKSDLEKIRCVYLSEADKRLPSPSILLRQPFYLSSEHTVEDIARFVLDIPPYHQA